MPNTLPGTQQVLYKYQQNLQWDGSCYKRSSAFHDWKCQSFESPCLCRAETHLPQLLASSLSVRRKVWNKHYQRRRGETQEQRGRSSQEEKDNPWRRMFFDQHLLTPSTFSLWGQRLSSEWTGEWHASAWWTRTQNSLAVRAEISCPVDIFGCFQQSAGVCIHTCWLSVIINTIMTAISGCCELGNTCIISQILTLTLWAMY